MYEQSVAQGKKITQKNRGSPPTFTDCLKNVLRTVSDLAEHYCWNIEVNILANHGLRVNF